jgi:hypothetical protein
MTVPALGRRIRALEGWFGLPLFVRGGQPLQLTPAGEQLARHARARPRPTSGACAWPCRRAPAPSWCGS